MNALQKNLWLIVFSITHISALAQVSVADVVFEKETIDLGEIVETTIPKSVKYIFTVKGSDNFELRHVELGCGCTNAFYDARVYSPGERGEIIVSFNPLGYSGNIQRDLHVKGNFKERLPEGKRLSFTAFVSELEQVPQSNYDFKHENLGELSLSRDQLYFGVHENGFMRVDTLFITNTNKNKPLKILGMDRNPAFLSAPNLPLTIAPGQKEAVLVRMDLSKKDTFGQIFGDFRLLTDDAPVKFKRITFYVKIVPYVTPLKKKALKKAPKFAIENLLLDFGKVKAGGKEMKSVEISNTGKLPLHIYRVDTDCGCISWSPRKLTIPPGEKRALNIVFDTVFKQGLQQKTIILYTNDPKNEQITLLATVNVLAK